MLALLPWIAQNTSFPEDFGAGPDARSGGIVREFLRFFFYPTWFTGAQYGESAGYTMVHSGGWFSDFFQGTCAVTD